MRLSYLAMLAVIATATLAPASEIHTAIKSGDLVAVEGLLQADAKRHANARERGESTPLHWAVLYNHPEMVKPLVAAGAILDARASNGSTATRTTPTPTSRTTSSPNRSKKKKKRR